MRRESKPGSQIPASHGRHLEDEDQRQHEAIVAQGPVILRCADYTFFFLTPDCMGIWPDDEEDAWQKLPPRQYLERLPRQTKSALIPVVDLSPPRPNRDHLFSHMSKSREDTFVSVIGRIQGPVDLYQTLVEPDEEPVGELRVFSHADRMKKIVVGRRALEAGLLVGRNERCGLQDLGLAEDNSLSRVHVLIISVEGVVYAVDTASSNGTLKGEDLISIARIEFEDKEPIYFGHCSLTWNTLN